MFCKQVSQINRLHLCSVFKYLKLTYYAYFRPAFNIFFMVFNYEVNISMLLSIKETSLTCLSFYDYFVNEMVTPWFPSETVMSRHRYISFTTKCRHYNISDRRRDILSN